MLACLTPAPQRSAEGNSSAPDPSAEQIVAKMVSRNQLRAAALRGFTGRRVYQLRYRGFPRDESAEMVVAVHYTAPSTKDFTVLSESGSRFIIKHVLKRLLTSEQEAQTPENRQETALTPRNYSFQLLRAEATPEGRCYVLSVQPKIANKFLYRGDVWVDAKDFAVARIDAEPAENPSIWISRTHIEQKYSKLGPFWLPQQNESTTKIRLGGTATLSIDYQNYTLSAETNIPAEDGQPSQEP
ncbi:MAG TPA: hypothetical protein VEJ67_12205 [Candidatus Cybelea sp.]|nr:hypothetical protein [Candidatus Cybelea sp.]